MMNFNNTILLGILVIFSSCINKGNQTKKPNIIYIYTDQQHARMMSCAGNNWLKTPAMDYLAENGIRFTRAYTTNPVCSPARISMMTGRFPGEFKDVNGEVVTGNIEAMKVEKISEKVEQTHLAAWLKKADYQLVYGGKQHLPDPIDPEKLGFNVISENERSDLAKEASTYIRNNQEKPYFMIVSLINPHDICYMAIRDFASTDQEKLLLKIGELELATLDSALKRPKGITEEEFFNHYVPPLPPNFEPQKDEPRAIEALVEERNFRKLAREQYTEQDWRLHRWAYCRLTEVVNAQIQIILDALKETGQEENTMVIFSSDHGDMDASHRLEHKSLLYEESANIPFIVMWKGQIAEGRVDSTHLVSNGLDFLPTVTDYAGIKGSADPRGLSLRPIIENPNANWRKMLGVESEVGRMVVHEDGYKYVKYYGEDSVEQLFDLNIDPYETTHFTNEAKYEDVKGSMQREFEEVWFP